VITKTVYRVAVQLAKPGLYEPLASGFSVKLGQPHENS
jgi:hypothetical protein